MSGDSSRTLLEVERENPGSVSPTTTESPSIYWSDTGEHPLTEEPVDGRKEEAVEFARGGMAEGRVASWLQASHNIDRGEHRRDEVDELKHQLRCAQVEIQQLTQRLAEAKQTAVKRDADTNQTLLKAESKLREARLRANAAIGFEEGDTDDAQKLIKHFDDVVEAVEDFAFSLVGKASEGELSTPINMRSLQALVAGDQRYAGNLIIYLSTMSHLGEVSDAVAQHVLQSTIFTFLTNMVFTPLYPGLRVSPEFEKVILDLCRRVSWQESQEHFSRWRGILHRAVQEQHNESRDRRVNELVDRLFYHLGGVLDQLLPPGTWGWRTAPANVYKILEPFRARAAKIISMAIEFQNSARVGYTSYEYSVFLPVHGEDYRSGFQERVELGPDLTTKLGEHARAQNTSGRILLSTSVGLMASRKEKDGTHNDTVVRKAAVVAA